MKKQLAGSVLGILALLACFSSWAAGEQEPARPAAEKFGPPRLKIATRYSISHAESASLLSLLVTSNCGFIDLKGKTVIEPQWEDADFFRDGFAPVKKNGKWGWINKQGALTDFNHPEPVQFQDGWALINGEGGKSRFVDFGGNTVLESKWERLWTFEEGLAAIQQNGKWGFIDRTGRVVIPPQWDSVLDFSEGFASVCRDNKCGCIDKQGKVVIPLEWESVFRFSEGFAQISRDRKYGFIDKTGHVVVEPQYESALYFLNGLASVAPKDKWGCIDTTGKTVVEPQFELLGPFAQGVAPAKQKGKWGLIDRTKRFVVEPEWDVAERYRETTVDAAPQFWLLARELETRSDPKAKVPHIIVKWLDSSAKEIWSYEQKPQP